MMADYLGVLKVLQMAETKVAKRAAYWAVALAIQKVLQKVVHWVLCSAVAKDPPWAD